MEDFTWQEFLGHLVKGGKPGIGVRIDPLIAEYRSEQNV